MNKDINPVELDFLLRFPSTPNVTSPVDFMNNWSWGGIKVGNGHTKGLGGLPLVRLTLK